MAKLLITGAAGKLGKQIVEFALQQVPASQLIVTSRDVNKLADLTARGVEARTADFTDFASLKAAFAGVTRVVLVSLPDLVPGARSGGELNVIKAAEEAGVQQLIYTSAIGVSKDSPLSIAHEYAATEEYLKGSKLPSWTIIQNGLWMESGVMRLGFAIATGTHTTAAQQAPCSYVSQTDCAQGAANVLVRGGFDKRTVVLGGAEVLTQEQLVAQMNEVTGLDVKVKHSDAAAAVAALVSAGLPQMYADLLVQFDLAFVAGAFGKVETNSEELLGRKPVTWRQFVEANKAKFLASKK
eukprot:TRINITY_DN3390_c0_g1_i1.p1 TRINITY_DN3390_c0_g1~~TRINITY_DN3390_c0_g1_i1.p1  ORF type:complete len:297 (+),score=77.44 TRINITY_DN3390_c0_g1_i1:37-927(+)